MRSQRQIRNYSPFETMMTQESSLVDAKLGNQSSLRQSRAQRFIGIAQRSVAFTGRHCCLSRLLLRGGNTFGSPAPTT